MKSILFILIATTFWALNFYLGKIMMEYLSPNTSAFWRYLFAVVILFLLSYREFPGWSKIRPHLWGLFLVGFVALFGFNFFFFQGLKHTLAVNGALIMSLTPALTTLFAVIFQGFKLDWKQTLGIILALFGVVYLLTQGQVLKLLELELNLGDCLFLVASVLFALQNIWIKKYAADLGKIHFTTFTNLFCLLGFVLLVPFSGPVLLPDLPARFWLAALGMGIPGTALAYFLWNYGLGKLGPARGAVFLNTVPLFTALFAVVFGAPLSFFHLISFILILGGLLLMQIKR